MIHRIKLPVIGLLVLFSRIAQAHPQAGFHLHMDQGLMSGWMHPLTGLDHLLAMIAVGLLAASGFAKKLWHLPAIFLLGMFCGGWIGSHNIALPATETLILGSVIGMGLALIFASRIPVNAALIMIAMFGLAHGHAHGAEIPQLDNPQLYAAGFMLMTLCLHVFGMIAGYSLLRFGRGLAFLKISGLAMVLVGVSWMKLG